MAIPFSRSGLRGEWIRLAPPVLAKRGLDLIESLAHLWVGKPARAKNPIIPARAMAITMRAVDIPCAISPTTRGSALYGFCKNETIP